MWQKIIISSCIKTFKQVLSFLSDMLYLYFGQNFTFLKFEASSWISRNSHPEVFCKKGILRNVAKFTGKHLCQRLLFNKVGEI